MRNGSTIYSKDRSLLGVQKMKKEKINFFNSDWQSLQGSKPKNVKKTKKQIESCKKTGFNNKKEILKTISTKKTIWKYLSKTKNKSHSIEIEPKECLWLVFIFYLFIIFYIFIYNIYKWQFAAKFGLQALKVQRLLER